MDDSFKNVEARAENENGHDRCLCARMPRRNVGKGGCFREDYSDSLIIIENLAKYLKKNSIDAHFRTY